MSQDTIDEKILQALSNKKKLADQITGDHGKNYLFNSFFTF
jgi:SNF2 family DNA or RNA helicase